MGCAGARPGDGHAAADRWRSRGRRQRLRRRDGSALPHPRATILCAGGAGALYDERRGAGDTTGDSYALAYQAGARLANMEFVQFSLYPVGPAGTRLPHNDDLLYLALGGTLANGRGERFLREAMLLIDQIRLERAPVANLVAEVQDQVARGLGSVRSPGGELREQGEALRYLRTLDQ